MIRVCQREGIELVVKRQISRDVLWSAVARSVCGSRSTTAYRKELTISL